MDWYLSLARGKQVFIAVFFAHLFCLCMLGADHWMHRVGVQHKKVIVNTFVTPAPKPVASAAPIVAAPPKVQPTSAPKKVQAKKADPKATTSPAVSIKKEESLLSDIEKNLQDLTSPSALTKKTNIEIPNFHSQPQLEANGSSSAEQIAALLQEALELPEFGEVKVKLAINRFGVLEHLEILEAKSQRNEEFLRRRLPELQFPRSSETVSLTIVFTNL